VFLFNHDGKLSENPFDLFSSRYFSKRDGAVIARSDKSPTMASSSLI